MTHPLTTVLQIQHFTGREATTMERLQCGALSGLVAQTVTYPIEVTRRRMQTIGIVGTRSETALSSLPCSTKRPDCKSLPTLSSTIQFLYTEQGTRGFLKGVSVNWLKGPIAFSISFTAFDHIKTLMESPQWWLFLSNVFKTRIMLKFYFWCCSATKTRRDILLCKALQFRAPLSTCL